MFALLNFEGLTLKAIEDDAYKATIEISTSVMKFDGIVEWLKANTKAL